MKKKKNTAGFKTTHSILRSLDNLAIYNKKKPEASRELNSRFYQKIIAIPSKYSIRGFSCSQNKEI